jgi:zinc protease
MFFHSRLALAIALSLVVTACDRNASITTPSTTAALPSGVTLVKVQEPAQGSLAIPYKKYKLSNGLTVIVHEDNSDPLVHVDVTYHVGSSREEPGKSGFAHFFEHMMFQGSEHVADEQHFKIITEAGGSMNGSTNTDRTNYFQTVPVNQLEKVLWLESDRMGFLVDAVTEQKFEVQRETVKNERGQRIDNRPYGRLSERANELMYASTHPYSWPVIGYMDDLNRANVNDVKAFFLRWYGPNNATLTIGGAISAEQVLPLVQKYFAEIPSGPAVEPLTKDLFSLTEDRYSSFEDNVQFPLISMQFPTVYARHPDEAALDILAQIIGGDNNSILYKNLIKTQFTVQAQSSHGCQELHCTFDLLALPSAGKSLSDIEAMLRQSLLEFEQRGVTDDDLLKVKAQIEASSIFGLQSVSGKVSQLAYNETFFSEPDLMASDIARYQAVTKADIVRVYEKYIKNQHVAVLSIVPNGKVALPAKADNYQVAARNFSGASTTKASDLQLRKTSSTVDRSQQPVAKANPSVNLPATWQTQLPNGIAILGSQSFETPTTDILLKIPAGLYYETAETLGSTAMLAALLNESSKNYSAEAMALALQKLGSNISVSADDQNINVFVSSLTKNLPATLTLLEEKLFRPAFSADDFARIQLQTIQGLEHASKDAGYQADRAFRELMFGQHIARFDQTGTLASLQKMQLASIQALYQKQFKPTGGQIILVSDLAQTELVNLLQAKLQQWQGQGEKLQAQPAVALAQAGTIYLIDKPDAAQSEIRIGKRSLLEDLQGEFYKAGLMNFALGGNFNSRLNLKLREEKGYTYGARAGFSADDQLGVYSASAAVRTDATAAAVQEFISEIARYHQAGISAEELEFTRNAVNQSDALKYETPAAKLGFMAKMQHYNTTADFVQQRQKLVSALSKTEVDALAKQHLDPASMAIVVVGDAKKIRPELEALGYPVKDYQF